MGKGKQGCLTPLPDPLGSGVADQAGVFAGQDVRTRWYPLLREDLLAILSSAPVIETDVVNREYDRLCRAFMSAHTPGLWIHDFRAALRSRVALQLAQEDAFPEALSMIDHPDLSFEAKQGLAREIMSEAADADDVSRARHFLAGLFYNACRPSDAFRFIEEDLSDPLISDERRAFAEEKQDFLASSADPVCWEEEIIPPEFRIASPTAWRNLLEFGLGDDDGQSAGLLFARRLAGAGLSDQAFALLERFEANQWSDGGASRVEGLRISILSELGRFDQLAESPECADFARVRKFDDAAQRLEQGGHVTESLLMRVAGDEAARFDMERSDESQFSSKKRLYLERLLKTGHFDKALECAEKHDSRDNISQPVRRLFVLTKAMETEPEGFLEEARELLQVADFSYLEPGSEAGGLRDRLVRIVDAAADGF